MISEKRISLSLTKSITEPLEENRYYNAMKHLLSLALMLASVVACAQSNEVPENLVGVKEVVDQIDSAVTQLLAQMYLYADNPGQAKTTWTDFRDNLLENKSDYNEESLTQCLTAIDVALKDLEQ